ncbi:hypothetical protein EIP91_004197 [Steccherinum ochraceum]|uniref:Uncharacterized protein n=1 Tax=Steccherinum ochraceum TaxID=92696 RepID=A0A4R0RBS1_9APHY|nr:hypothetical protein EIP91_004197 [Steccherinum ochraceum]
MTQQPATTTSLGTSSIAKNGGRSTTAPGTGQLMVVPSMSPLPYQWNSALEDPAQGPSSGHPGFGHRPTPLRNYGVAQTEEQRPSYRKRPASPSLDEEVKRRKTSNAPADMNNTSFQPLMPFNDQIPFEDSISGDVRSESNDRIFDQLFENSSQFFGELHEDLVQTHSVFAQTDVEFLRDLYVISYLYSYDVESLCLWLVSNPLSHT